MLVFEKYGALFGILPSITGTITIISCYYYTVIINKDVPSWLYIPVISLLGCKNEEQLIYQIGFTITGLLTILNYYTFSYTILKYINNTKELNEIKYKLHISLLFIAFGVIGQGIITMESDAINYITKSAEENPEKINWKPGMQSIIHQLLAMVFFMASMYHGFTSIQLYFNDKINGKYISKLKYSKYYKILLLAFPFIFQFISFIYHPISTGNKSQDDLNIAGITQWLTVFCYLFFFASYSFDYISITKMIMTEKKVKQN